MKRKLLIMQDKESLSIAIVGKLHVGFTRLFIPVVVILLRVKTPKGKS